MHRWQHMTLFLFWELTYPSFIICGITFEFVFVCVGACYKEFTLAFIHLLNNRRQEHENIMGGVMRLVNIPFISKSSRRQDKRFKAWIGGERKNCATIY